MSQLQQNAASISAKITVWRAKYSWLNNQFYSIDKLGSNLLILG